MQLVELHLSEKTQAHRCAAACAAGAGVPLLCGAASGWQRGGCMDAVEGCWRRAAEQTLCRGLWCNTCVYGELTWLR